MISRTLFDESFTNAWPFARFDSNAPYMATMSSCLSPRPLPPDYPPDVVTNLVVTNATLTWSAIPYSSSSSVALGIGSLAPVENDPSVDTDGDELADYDEVYVHGSDPFLVDSDFDGVNDTVEIHEGTDPADPFSFWQRLTVTVTNTVSLACPVRVALGYSATGWETNGATAFASGFGETTYTNASSQGVAYVKAYCDLDGNGEYDADGDILLVRPIPYEGTAQIGFTFGDVDGDGVSDVQEREELTDPYDDKNFRMVVMVNVESSDVASGLTNFVAWGHSPVGWETNGLTAFAEASVAYPIDALATNGTLFVKVFRDFNADGVYDAGVDALASSRLTKKENGKTVTLRIGDSDNDRVPDSIERGEGTDPFDGRNYCFDMAVTVTRIFQTTNRLTLAAMFGEATIYGPTMMTTNVWAMDFGHLATTNRENVVLTFWDDANSNGIHEVAETSVELVLYVTNHVNICSHRLSYGAFDANNDNVLDWWMIREGLVAEGVANRLYDDPDGDGLVNLHEFWSGTHPLIPDGSNTLLSVVARSIDDRIRDIDLATAIPRFVDYFANGPTNAFVVNTNFWAKDLDLSCVSVWHPGDNPGSKAATLVTRRHVVMAQHWFSNTYAFCDTNGLVCVRSILQAEHISDDLRLGRLNQPLPESFRPAKVLTADFDRYLASGRYLPTLCLNHEKGATIHELENLNCEVSEGLWRHYTQYGATSQTNLVSAQRCGVRGVTVDGNSGCPFFIVAENELILLFSKHLGWPQVMTWSPSSGPMLSFRLAAIQHKINEWEGDDADLYQIEQFDLSAYGEIVNP